MRVGNVLKEKWHLDALLGVGGMASVYLATHQNNAKRVAVKMLHPELSVVTQVKTRFLREGYASNKVNHPGVVSVLDDDTAEDGSVFLVMELLEGENLEQRRAAAGGKLDLLEVLWAVDQLLDVLAAAHKVGIIHRDIKPENIFLTNQAELKVLDFGLARVQHPQSRGLTRTNMLMGTLDFMAPEQARGNWDGVGVQADLWSVGATMFMLLTGHPVHEESTMEGQLRAATTRPARSIKTLLPNLPAPVITLVDRALAFNTKDRWSDALVMQEAVRDAYIKVGGDNPVPTTIRPPIVLETPTPAAEAAPRPSSQWDSDLLRTNALGVPGFDDDVTRNLDHLDSLPHELPPPTDGYAPVPPHTASFAPPPVPVLPPEALPAGAADYAPINETATAFAPAQGVPAPIAPADTTDVEPRESVWKRHKGLILLSLPLWLLVIAVLVKLSSCQSSDESSTPAASASASAEPPPSASAPPPPVESAEPPPAASASAKKPGKTPPVRPPINTKKKK